MVDALPALAGPVRATILAIVLGLVTVFVIASRLDPYRGGRTWSSATHTQLGLPPCNFKTVTGWPCPSCGMTTSFALFVRGDVVSALRANSVGTLLATFCLALIPWGLASTWRKQPMFILSLERAATRLLIAFLWLMLARWATVLALYWWNGSF